MEKGVVDTNILVSASFWKGKPYHIIRAAVLGKFLLVLSPAILDEYSRVLARDFYLSNEQVVRRIQFFSKIAEVVHPIHEINAISVDPSDNRILEAAVSGKANFIVSGDKHLLTLKIYNGIPILTAHQALGRLQ